MPEFDSPVEWLSAVSSIASAVIAMVTLLTVYLAAVQLATQNRMYKLGLSYGSLGPWRPRVAVSSSLGLRRRIYTPTLNLPSLVESAAWKPELTFPIGFPKSPNPDVEEGTAHVQVKASWVNFMQALSISPNPSPDGKDIYEMQDASELVNGVVPMPWVGKDLVSICSILGFQSHENKPSFKDPMPLPMQWSGPLGWLQFRSSTNGCVAEFRRRMRLFNQIPDTIHRHWQNEDMPNKDHFLRSRLWHAIGGFSLPDGGVLYLGGAESRTQPRDMQNETSGTEESPTRLFDDLVSTDMPDEDILDKLFGEKDRPKAVQRDADRNNITQANPGTHGSERSGFLDSLFGGELEKLKSDSSPTYELIRPCPGLLSTSIGGELACSRGLGVNGWNEYDRKYLPADEKLDSSEYRHRFGDLCMNDQPLRFLKEALLFLRPDGFYFSPARMLIQDLTEIYGHIDQQSNRVLQIFPVEKEENIFEHAEGSAAKSGIRLCQAMILCNNLQSTRKTARAMYSVEDMRILAKASHSLKPIISGPGQTEDLVWAMLYCPDLSRHIRTSLTRGNLAQFAAAEARCEGGVLDCATLPGLCGSDAEKPVQYTVPLVGNGTYTGMQILAAMADVFIRYYWIDKRWISDVTMYDFTIPQSVAMC
ncbi:hypothetical protein QBC44DRAFT_302390 [Cladorrhinum sp. PSN332]|nr:hypothetical protein QBC44DRAFT_302390 [Cladorrhinum sp. PSN332]